MFSTDSGQISSHRMPVINLLSVIFTLTVIEMFFTTNVFFDFNKYYYIRYLLAAFWVFAAITVFIYKRALSISKTNFHILTLYANRYVITALYSLVIIYLGGEATSFYTRMLSTTLYQLLAVCFVMSSIYLLREKSVDCIFYAGVINYAAVIAKFLNEYGISGLLHFIQLNNANITTMLEVNELTFTFAVFFIYYCFMAEHYPKARGIRLKIIISAAIIFFGFKRSVFAAVLIILAITLIMHRKKWAFTKNIIRVFSLCFILMAFLYVWLIVSGGLAEIANKYGINFMARLQLYDFIKREGVTFSPLYLGHGIGYVELEIANNIWYLSKQIIGIKAMGLHSDIFKYYIEIGFFGLLYIMYYVVIRQPLYFLRYNCSKTCQLAFRIAVLTAILYLTDNTSVYFTFIVVAMLLPVSNMMFIERKAKMKGE